MALHLVYIEYLSGTRWGNVMPSLGNLRGSELDLGMDFQVRFLIFKLLMEQCY